MATVVHLDTHIVAWLYAGLLAKIPRRIQALIERSQLAMSPMVVLELEYLHEIGRLKVSSAVVTDDLRQRIGLAIATTGFPHVVAAARQQTWTRDPFDRVIAGQAQVEHAALITADQIMRQHVTLAEWE